MLMHQITDWDDAYANGVHIPDGKDYPAKWAAAAKLFRDQSLAAEKADLDIAYGDGPRNRLDLFHPQGHLATRMVCRNTPLGNDVLSRIERTVSISGVHDLRPLMKTEMNDTLHIDRMEALLESPALLEPVGDTRLVCWVGAGERAEFIRQNALLASMWKGLGAATASVEEPDRHHFNVIDGLLEASHPLTCALCA